MPITLLDGLLIAVMLISAFLAMIRGFVREVLSIASWIVAALVAYLFYDELLPLVKDYIANQYVALAVAVAAIFFVTLIIVSYITMRISDFVLDSRIGALDRTLGFVFGAGRGLLLVVVAMLFFNWFVPEEVQPRWISAAKSKPLLNTIGDRLIAALPEDPESAIFDRLRQRQKNPATPEAPAGESTNGDTQSKADDPEKKGYESSERRGLDQLIQSSDN